MAFDSKSANACPRPIYGELVGTLRYFTSCRNALEADVAVADLRAEGIRAQRRSDLVAIAYPMTPSDIYVDEEDWEFAALVRPDLIHPEMLPARRAQDSADDDPLAACDRRRGRVIGAVVVVALVAPVVVSIVHALT